MQKIILQILLLALVGLTSCSENSDVKQETLTQGELLLKAYETDSKEELLKFFEEWESVSIPKTEEEIQNEPTEQVRACYRIYEEFYNPFNLNYYGDSTRYPEVGDDFYSDTEFVIIQNRINLTFDNYQVTEYVTDFRPKCNLDNHKFVYLTDEYEKVLKNFLDDQLSWEEVWKRYEFLNNFTKISPGHWFGWHFETHPKVYGIDFDYNLESARVDFRIRYEGGEATFENSTTENSWELQESHLTWIE